MSEKELQKRIAALEAEVAALRPAPIPPAAKYEEPAVRISYPASKGAFEMATDAQLKSLLKIVLARFPHLKLKGDIITEQDEEKYFDGFRGAFYRLGHQNQLADDKLDSSHANGFWLDNTQD